jgi:aldehyde dehydrogenase (NAD+)
VERSRLIYKLADLIERDQQLLAELESIDNGKPVRIARCEIPNGHAFDSCLDNDNNGIYNLRDGDIADTIGCLRYYAGWADKIVGQVSCSAYPDGNRK